MIYYAALLHDLGMLGLSKDVVGAHRKLKQEELRYIRTHVAITAEKLRGKMDTEILNIALAHHERGDGSGYPLRLNERKISVAQGVLQIGDAVGAMISKRSYRDSVPKQQVVGFLNEEVAKKRFKKQLVSVFVDSYDEILEHAKKDMNAILKMYQVINAQYAQLSRKYKI